MALGESEATNFEETWASDALYILGFLHLWRILSWAFAKPGSFFNGANNTNIYGGTFINNSFQRPIYLLLIAVLCAYFRLPPNYEVQQQPVLLLAEPVLGGARRTPNILYDKVAMNAILNIGGRAEDAKCYPGTREEVIGLIEQWIDSRNHPNRIMWLSGPAGGGKTAIMKTIAERSKNRNIRTVNFFFRGDPTRNDARLLVPTLLYQILQLYPVINDAVARVLSDNPLILDASIQEQFEQLLFPLSDIIRESRANGNPIVIHVDGLDECDVDAKHSQAQVLRALDNLVTRKNSVFLAVVASRPEPRIRMLFNQLTSSMSLIFLDDQYSPQKDIHRFVAGEFNRIKASHPNAHPLPDNWPSKSAIDAIVSKSSGQCIYAATVMRFLESSSAVPSLSLERVQGIVPAGRNSPFTHLDAFYTFILNQADDHEATHDLLSSQLYIDWGSYHRPPHRLMADPLTDETLRGLWSRAKSEYGPIQVVLEIINPRYTKTVFASCLSDLSALVQLQNRRLVFYHASMADFLLDPSRSNLSYVDLSAFAAKVFPAVWNSHEALFTFFAWNPFHLISQVQQPTPAITQALLTKGPSSFNDYGWDDHRLIHFFTEISRLYYPHDFKSYWGILRMWTTWAVSYDLLSPSLFGFFYWRYLPQVPFFQLFVFLATLEKYAASMSDFIYECIKHIPTLSTILGWLR